MANENKMNIIDALKQLRKDLQKWVANNLKAVRTIDTDIILAGDYETIGNKKAGDKFVKGTNIQDILKEILTKRIVPTKPTPKIELSGGVYEGDCEVGTVITPEVICRLNPGKYSDDYPSQVRASEWTVSIEGIESQTVNATEDKDTTTVELDTSFTITDSMAQANPITIAVKHPAEDSEFELKDNLGGELTSDERTHILITENMAENKTTNGFTGFRYWFYGYRRSDSNLISIANINSDTFRKGGFTTARDGFPTRITTNKMQQMFFAAPAGIVNTVKISNSINGAPQTVKKTQVRIKGNNDYVVTTVETDPNSQGMLYDLFYVDNDNAETSETTYTITTLLK